MGREGREKGKGSVQIRVCPDCPDFGDVRFLRWFQEENLACAPWNMAIRTMTQMERFWEKQIKKLKSGET